MIGKFTRAAASLLLTLSTLAILTVSFPWSANRAEAEDVPILVMLDDIFRGVFLDEIRFAVSYPDSRRPNLDEPNNVSADLSVDEYMVRLANIYRDAGGYTAFERYLRDQDFELIPQLSEYQFYAILGLANVSFNNGDWGDIDREEFTTSLYFSMEELMLGGYDSWSDDMGEFFHQIGFEQAAFVHPQISIAYNAYAGNQLLVEEADRLGEEAARASAEVDRLLERLALERELGEFLRGN